MRVALWLTALFAIAVASALFAGNNPGTVNRVKGFPTSSGIPSTTECPSSFDAGVTRRRAAVPAAIDVTVPAAPSFTRTMSEPLPNSSVSTPARSNSRPCVRYPSAPIVATRLCLYGDSWDGNFLIDRDPDRPGLVVAAGDSGH